MLVDGPGWRWCFFVGVPVGVLALGVFQRHLHLPSVRRAVRIDHLGAALITGGVSTVLTWISPAGSSFAWASTLSLTLAALEVLALVAAVFVELRAPEPVVPMSLFRNRTVVLAVLRSVVIGLVMFGGTVFLGQYLQIARSYPPTGAGLLTLPLVGGLIAASTVSGQLIRWYGTGSRRSSSPGPEPRPRRYPCSGTCVLPPPPTSPPRPGSGVGVAVTFGLRDFVGSDPPSLRRGAVVGASSSSVGAFDADDSSDGSSVSRSDVVAFSSVVSLTAEPESPPPRTVPSEVPP